MLQAAAVKPCEIYSLTITLDPDYLADPNTTYPIRIDPTVELVYTENTPNAIEEKTLQSNNTTSETNRSSDTQSHDTTIIWQIREVIKGDTIVIRDSIIIYRDRWRTRTDTLIVNKTDTTTITKTVEVEKPIAPFVKKSCIALWSIIGVAILALIVWLVWGFATKKFSLIKLIGLIK